jgi:glucokinase
MRAEDKSLVIDVGATRTRIALAADGFVTNRVERQTAELVDLNRPERGIVDRLAALAGEYVSDAAEHPMVVGISVAGSIGYDGSVLQRRAFGVPDGPALRDALAGALQLPVAIDNDANCAALAEQHYGAANGCRWVAVLTLGTNIGLGLILDNQLIRGARGAAGEVGLLLVPAITPTDPRTPADRLVDAGRFGRVRSDAPAGYAWIEELIGGGALRDAAQGAKRVLTAEAYADPFLRPLADRAAEGWALIIADLMVLVDLEVVVLTGGLAADAPHLLAPLRRRVAELVAHAPEIRLGTLGPDAELIGADLLARAALAEGSARHAGAGPSAQSTGG